MEARGGFSIFDLAAADDTTVVDVAGEVDMGTGPAFQRGLLRAIGASRGGLIVDLSHATFLDSSALTSLVNAFDHLRHCGGGSLAIVASDPRMRALFEVARLERDFLIFSTRDEALAATTPSHQSETANEALH
jgi:anti-sigma B factor antagonist